MYRSPEAYDVQGDKVTIITPTITPPLPCKCASISLTNDSRFSVSIDLSKIMSVDAGTYTLQVQLSNTRIKTIYKTPLTVEYNQMPVVAMKLKEAVEMKRN